MSEIETVLPAKKEEIGGSYVIRAKIGPDAEITFNGFYRHDVTKAQLDYALDLFATAVKRQQAIANMDVMELQVERGLQQIETMSKMAESVGSRQLTGKAQTDHNQRLAAIEEARKALAFNVRKRDEYKALVGNGGNGHAAPG